jgi:hypothetical protein
MAGSSTAIEMRISGRLLYLSVSIAKGRPGCALPQIIVPGGRSASLPVPELAMHAATTVSDLTLYEAIAAKNRLARRSMSGALLHASLTRLFPSRSDFGGDLPVRRMQPSILPRFCGRGRVRR